MERNRPPGGALILYGHLRWQTNYLSAGTYPGIKLTASDGAASSSETIGITVTQTDQAPLFSTLPPLFTSEQHQIQFTLTATDPDATPSSTRLQRRCRRAPIRRLERALHLDAELRPGGRLHPRLHGNGSERPGRTRARCTYGHNVNRVPTLSFTNHQVVVGDTMQFAIVGSDPDVGDTVRFSARGLPDGAKLDPVTGAFSWTPGPVYLGGYLVTVDVTDGKSTVGRGLELRVNAQPVGPAPAIVLTPSFPAFTGQQVSITVLADAFSAVASRTLSIDGVPVLAVRLARPCGVHAGRDRSLPAGCDRDRSRRLHLDDDVHVARPRPA